MQGEAVVVAEYALVIVGTTRILSLQHMVNLIVFVELIEVLPRLNLSCIVTKDLVKEEVAILKTSYMDRNHRYTSFI